MVDPGCFPVLPCCDSCERSHALPSPSTPLFLPHHPVFFLVFLWLPLRFVLGHPACMNHFISKIKIKSKPQITDRNSNSAAFWACDGKTESSLIKRFKRQVRIQVPVASPGLKFSQSEGQVESQLLSKQVSTLMFGQKNNWVSSKNLSSQCQFNQNRSKSSLKSCQI